jgi:hypothetical protein
MLKNTLSCLVAVVLGLAILFWGEKTFAPSFQSCVIEQSNNTGVDPAKNYYGSVRVVVSNYTVCTVHLIDTHAPLFTAVASFVIAAFTGTLWIATTRMLRAASKQSAAMEESIEESAKSADAIASVAESMATNVEFLRETVDTNRSITYRQKTVSEMQLRAYLSVSIGNAVAQNRSSGTHFLASAKLVNLGATPATKVNYKINAAILGNPLPKDWDLTLPDETTGETMIPTRQDRTIVSAVPNFCDDAEIESIKRGIGKGLYIWGMVTYEDTFAQPRETTFCHLLTWLPDGTLWGYYVADRNTMT